MWSYKTLQNDWGDSCVTDMYDNGNLLDDSPIEVFIVAKESSIIRNTECMPTHTNHRLTPPLNLALLQNSLNTPDNTIQGLTKETWGNLVALPVWRVV